MTNQEIIHKFVCLLMKNGKKSVATKLLNNSLKGAANKLAVSEDTLLNQILTNVRPSVDARSKKVGRVSYIIPYAITEQQSIYLALKLLVKSARERREKQFVNRLVNEFIDSFNNKGLSVKKKNELHKLAEANKSFAFFR